jgi:hypothetical protein
MGPPVRYSGGPVPAVRNHRRTCGTRNPNILQMPCRRTNKTQKYRGRAVTSGPAGSYGRKIFPTRPGLARQAATGDCQFLLVGGIVDISDMRGGAGRAHAAGRQVEGVGVQNRGFDLISRRLDPDEASAAVIDHL